jgi:hypothetical protein
MPNKVAAMAEKLDKPTPTVPAFEVVVVDPNNAPVQYFDWIATGGRGPAGGTLNLVLAAIDYAIMTDGKPQAIVQARLRMSVNAAMNLHRFLGELLTGTGDAPSAPKPPSNTLN